MATDSTKIGGWIEPQHCAPPPTDARVEGGLGLPTSGDCSAIPPRTAWPRAGAARKCCCAPCARACLLHLHPGGHLHGPGGQPVQTQAQHVDGWSQQLCIDPGQQQRHQAMSAPEVFRADPGNAPILLGHVVDPDTDGFLGCPHGLMQGLGHLFDHRALLVFGAAFEHVDLGEWHGCLLPAASRPRSRAMVMAVSSIMSSCPPTMPRRPISTRMSRAGTPYFCSARLANSRKEPETPAEPSVSASRSMRIGKSMMGTTKSSATSWILNTSTPVAMPIRSHTAISTSIGVLPGPAPRPAAASSMRLAPTSMAAIELATPIARLWWPWKPSSVSGFSASRTAPTRALTVSGSRCPAESVT